jgi:hypothetical protein
MHSSVAWQQAVGSVARTVCTVAGLLVYAQDPVFLEGAGYVWACVCVYGRVCEVCIVRSV